MAMPLAFEIPLRWSDMDAYGHVNNVQFLRLLEDARVIGFREWFGEEESVLEKGIVVSRHEIEYHAPLTFRPEPVLIEMWVTGLSGAGFTLGYVVRDQDELGGRVYAVAESGVVLYDFASGRPRRLAARERELVGELLGEPVAFRWQR